MFIEDLFLPCKTRMRMIYLYLLDRLTEFPEGRLLEKRHLQRERNLTLIKLAKQLAIDGAAILNRDSIAY